MQKQQNLTAKQHFVPRFLLKNWAIAADKSTKNFFVHSYDLMKKFGKAVPAKSILYSEYLYEDCVQSPDNELENYLNRYETNWAKTLMELKANIHLHCSSQSKLSNFSVSGSAHRNLVQLAAYQLLRTPTAKQTISEQKDVSLEQFSFKDVFSIDEDLISRLTSMLMVIQYSSTAAFFCSDNPCFEIKDHYLEPEFVRELGIESSVLLVFPVLPSICLTFVHRGAAAPIQKKQLLVKVSNGVVANQNMLTTQAAVRFVIASMESDYQTIQRIAQNRPAISRLGY